MAVWWNCEYLRTYERIISNESIGVLEELEVALGVRRCGWQAANIWVSTVCGCKFSKKTKTISLNRFIGR